MPCEWAAPYVVVIPIDDDQDGDDMFDAHTPRWLVLVGALLLFLAACGSETTTADTADTADTAEAADAADAAAPADTTAPADTAETSDSPAVEESPAEPVTADAAVEPNFELTGELELTTAEINDMVAFVEQSAGREFVTPPIIQIVSVEEFEAGLTPDEEFQALIDANSETSARFMQALGHTTLNSNELEAAFADLRSSTELISGRYDPWTDEVLIPEGVLVGDDFDAILVHELLHALDDQYVDLGALLDEVGELAAEEVSSDRAFQIAAVVEGRATTTQFEWMQANGVIPGQPEIPESFNEVPASALNEVVLPYQLGAQSIFQLGGVEATWELYEEFPASSEQMVFPNRIGTDEPIAVAPPAVDGEVFAEGVLGVEGMLLLGIGNTLEPSQVEIISAITAAEGWGGDYYVLTGDEAESCLSVSIVADTEQDLAELSDMFTEWAGRENVHTTERSATVDGDTLSIRSCAPFIS